MDSVPGIDVDIRIPSDNLLSDLSEADPSRLSGNLSCQSIQISNAFLQFLLLHKLQTEFGSDNLFSHSINFIQQKVDIIL